MKKNILAAIEDHAGFLFVYGLAMISLVLIMIALFIYTYLGETQNNKTQKAMNITKDLILKPSGSFAEGLFVGQEKSEEIERIVVKVINETDAVSSFKKAASLRNWNINEWTFFIAIYIKITENQAIAQALIYKWGIIEAGLAPSWYKQKVSKPKEIAVHAGDFQEPGEN